jgi:UDP-N-acetylmuramoylalanine--D-glutamate ligase
VITKGERVTVMGLGRFGGGLGVSQWLLDEGANVLLTDLATEEELFDQIEPLKHHPNITFVLGEHRTEDFTNTDLVIANPAVSQPWNNRFLQAAWESNVRVSTEIELVTQQLSTTQVIGVTGTSGKSTTVSMIHAGLEASGVRSHLGGNIGGSLLQSISGIDDNDIVVLELSSAMLWWLEKAGGWSPHIAVLTNVEENHVDWHGSFEEYSRCKELLFAFQTENDIALTQDSEATFSGLQVVGKHNERNAAIAFLAAIAVNANPELARSGIQNFRGLPHRLQEVGEGYYNDSKSTTPQATVLAIDAFTDASKVHVIVGGYDKQIDLSLLAKQADRVGGMYAIGATAQEIESLANDNVQICNTLECAVSTAQQSMEQGDFLLLSPGCASWDQFENYEKRGERFCELTSCSP